MAAAAAVAAAAAIAAAALGRGGRAVKTCGGWKNDGESSYSGLPVTTRTHAR